MISRRAVKRLFGKVIVALLIAVLCSASLAAPAKGATATQINDSIASGVAWLVSQQSGDGSWPGGYAADTGFALAVLEHNAEHLGKAPLDSTYLYHTNVQNGLNYLFANATYDAGNHWVYWNVGGNNAYQTGPCLMGIARSGAPTATVVGGALNGFTYKQVAQMGVDWLGSAQVPSGQTNVGAWYYTKGSPFTTGGDQSATGWATMGLGYAIHSMGCTWPAGLLDRLALWNEHIQEHNPGPDFGGAGYTQSGSWTNVYKTGHLLFAQSLTGLTVASQRVQDALTFMNLHWNDLTNGYSSYQNFGWRGNPPETKPSYIATIAATKGFTELGIETFNGRDWYSDFADVIVTNQWPDGHWLGGGYGEFTDVRSTCWALLTLLRATSHVPPTVVTKAATNVCMNTVTLNGFLGNMGTSSSVNVSFEYRTSSGSYEGHTFGKELTAAPASFSADIDGLAKETTYYFRVKAQGDATAYGDEMSFTTTAYPCNQAVDLLPPIIKFPDFSAWPGITGASGTSVPDKGVPTFTVNRSPFDLQFTIEDDSTSGVRWTLFVDGRSVTSSDGTGTFTRSLPLFEGRNDVLVTAVDGTGNTTSRHIGITLDTHAPVVTLAGTLQSMVTGTTLNVEGTITDDVSGVRSLNIGGIDVIPYMDGTFTASVPLKRGLNTIAVETLDKAGNHDSFTWTLDLTPVSQPRVRRTIDLTIDSTVMVVDGASVTMDVAPVIREDRTLLPLRALVQELGGSIAWNAKTRHVTVKARGVTMVLTIGKNTATVNGTSILIDPENSKVVPVIIGGRTFLPLRFIGEQLGLDIGWYPPTRTVTITWEP